MLPEVGFFCLILALCCSGVLAGMPFIYRNTPTQLLHNISIRLVNVNFILVLSSMIALLWSFYTCDYSVAYVQQNAHNTLPYYYRLTAVWGGHEGSMLLWILLLAGWAFAVSKRQGSLQPQAHSTMLSILGGLMMGLLLFLIFTSNPFQRILPIPAPSGSDLNPLLQDPGLICHPPLLYMGYVGLAVPFASQICALFFPEQQADLVKWARKWVLVAWGFLTLGIVLGSYWAYYELGWGGYWFWDPVENASFMPWLVCGALVHSLAITEKRKLFQAWTVLLAIYTFSLSLVGTFLVRSGVLTSVHAFAVSPERGLFILIFLSLVIGLSLLLFCLKGHKLSQPKQRAFSMFSKETILLLNNLLLVTVASTILLGTLYPLIIDALTAQKLSVGPPYFNTVFIPMMLPLMFIMGMAPGIHFYQDGMKKHWQAHRFILVSCLILIGFLWSYYRDISFAFGIAIGCWVLVLTLKFAWQKYNKNAINKRVLGMILAHCGVGIVILGLSLSHQFSIEKDVDIHLNESIAINEYIFHFTSLGSIKGPNYEGVQARFDVSRYNKPYKTLLPERRYYVPRELPMSETAIDSNLLRDLYIALSEPTSETSWAVRIYLKPFIVWIWLGGVLVALGAFLSAWPKSKYDSHKQPLKMIKEPQYG